MKFRRLHLLLALLPGIILPQVAAARMGDSLDQLMVRYGETVSNSAAKDFNDSADYLHLPMKMYAFAYQGYQVTAILREDKSINETYTAPTNNPHFTDEQCLALAGTISAHTNWSKIIHDTDSMWVADYTLLEIDREAGRPDQFTVTASKYDLHVAQNILTNLMRQIDAAQAKAKEPPPPTADERVLKSQQALADKGDPYGERQMGLRYRDGNGVKADIGKARELLQKAANQGDQEAADALASFHAIVIPSRSVSEAHRMDQAGITIDSAVFAGTAKSIDVTQKVIDLLRDSPDNYFVINRGTLGVDPAPGKKKFLTVKYKYKGKAYTIRIQAGNDLDFSEMIDRASDK